MRARTIHLSDGTLLTAEWKPGEPMLSIHYQETPHGVFHTKKFDREDAVKLTLLLSIATVVSS